ncbi:hypothetical protein OIO90_005335 [Microbotryomycetes sp. JL221]|nr:hypothetical protein OIO90_005335 [Microbotryomycetes sp. JL221]
MSAELVAPTSPSGYLSPSWVVPPSAEWPGRTRRGSDAAESGVTDLSSSSESSWDSLRQAEEDQLQWEESIRQLQLLINVVLIPFAAKWAGRQWAYWTQCTRTLRRRWQSSSAPRPKPREQLETNRSEDVHRQRRFTGLSNLQDGAYRLRFRSFPYSTDPSILFTNKGPHVHSYNAGPLFQLRCFPSPKRRPANQPPRPKSDHLQRPTPPPSLAHTVNWRQDSADPVISKAQRLDHLRWTRNRRKPYTLELTIIASKKNVHKHAVVRQRCKRRLEEAFRLVLVRGACLDDNGQLIFESNPDEVGPKKWVVPGFSYCATITLELFRHPLPSLVEQVRKALSALKTRVEQSKLEELLNSIQEMPPSASKPSDDLARP